MFQNINEDTIEIDSKNTRNVKSKINLFSKVFTKENITLYLVSFMLSLVSLNGEFSIFSISMLGACFASSVPLLGIIVVWYSYDGVYSYLNRIKKLQEISTYSFFVYVAHEPLLTGIKKILLSISNSSSMILIIYFFEPLITIFICLIIGKFFRMRIPKVYHIISGGR